MNSKPNRVYFVRNLNFVILGKILWFIRDSVPALCLALCRSRYVLCGGPARDRTHGVGIGAKFAVVRSDG